MKNEHKRKIKIRTNGFSFNRSAGKLRSSGGSCCLLLLMVVAFEEFVDSMEVLAAVLWVTVAAAGGAL